MGWHFYGKEGVPYALVPASPDPLKGRIILFLTAFFAALMVQMYVNHYQSNVVLDQLGRQTGNFHSISQFSSGISRQLTALENFRWENGDANALMQTLQSGSTTADTWLWRIDGDLREVGEEQYLLAQAVRTTYENYDRLMDELQTDLKRGDTEEAAALYYGEVTLCGGYLQQYTDELLQTAITEGQSTYTRLSALNERLKGVQAVTTLLCVLLGALFVRTVWHLLDPVQQMIVASRAIGRGELDTPDVIVQQTDEIGQLAGAFNTMKHSMARQVNMLREKNEIERQLHRRETEAMEREALADLVARRFEHEAEIHTTDNGRRTVETALLWGGGPDPHGHRDARRQRAGSRPHRAFPAAGMQGDLCHRLRPVPVCLRGHAPGGLRLHPQTGGARRGRRSHPPGPGSD